eukprot:CCRYP_020811-RA/>CCRYP_020811-RA protein AED:0.46 eAED:0.46 QI:0/-1/0/1/-1/1/1/0/117
MEALTRIEQTLQPTHNKTGHEAEVVHSPRVHSDLPQEPPRVRFDDRPPRTLESPPRLVVAWPQEQIVQQEAKGAKPMPILKPSKYAAKPSESIPSRVKARRQAHPIPTESIAERVAQ